MQSAKSPPFHTIIRLTFSRSPKSPILSAAPPPSITMPRAGSIKITDVIGMTSEFTYDAGDFITTLTTPYGVTTFTKSEPGTTRSLETIYPDGDRDRVEYNQSTTSVFTGSDPCKACRADMATTKRFLFFRNTYYWDKKALRRAYPDYTKAKIYHWLHEQAHNLTHYRRHT